MPLSVIVVSHSTFLTPSSLWGKSRCEKTWKQERHEQPRHSKRWCHCTPVTSSQEVGLIVIRQPDFIFPTVVYELSDVLNDLMEFSARHLRPGGRLVFWLPVIRDLTYETHIPQHPLLRLISNCEQPFNQCNAFKCENLMSRVADASYLCEE